MKKEDIVKGIYGHSHLSLKESKAFVETVLSLIKNALFVNETVKISGFGTFKVVPTKRTIVTDFTTGKRIRNKPKKKIKYIQSTRIK